MSTVAILGAGPLGGAIAHEVARRAVATDVILVDAAVHIAEGKALDLRQAGAIAGLDVCFRATGDVERAAGVDVVVLADRAEDGREWQGETGLALLQQLARRGAPTPLVLAGAEHAWLVERAVDELLLPDTRAVCTATLALAGAARALVAACVDGAAGDVVLPLAGRPPRVYPVWQRATIGGECATTRLGAPGVRGVERRLAACWPPGPLALASAAARVCAAILTGSRREWPCVVARARMDGPRAVASIRLARFGPGGIVEARDPEGR